MTARIEVLTKAFREAFDLNDGVAVEDLAFRDIEEWDSVGHMRLVAKLEDAFDIMLETEDVIDLSSFNKALEIVAKYGVTD
ncbi:MAG: acyl carrier protein [bacterium]|nr:acyl carrier protein [bacterium]